MSDHEVSQSCDILPHDHSTIGSNLRLVGVRHEPVTDGIGLIVGFRKVRTFQCSICGKSIEEVDPEIFPPGEH